MTKHIIMNRINTKLKGNINLQLAMELLLELLMSREVLLELQLEEESCKKE